MYFRHFVNNSALAHVCSCLHHALQKPVHMHAIRRYQPGLDPGTWYVGTVIAGPSSLLLVSEVPGFRSRTTSPMQGEGLQIQGNFTGALTANGIITLADATGERIFSTALNDGPISATAG